MFSDGSSEGTGRDHSVSHVVRNNVPVVSRSLVFVICDFVDGMGKTLIDMVI